MTIENTRAIARFIPEGAVLVKRLLADPRVPRSTKIVLGIGLSYIASPVDLVPDSVPVLGQLDDALVLAAVGGYLFRTTGREIVEELWPGSKDGFDALKSLVTRPKVPIAGRVSLVGTLRPRIVARPESPPGTPTRADRLDDPFVRELESISWDPPRRGVTRSRGRVFVPQQATAADSGTARIVGPAELLSEPVSPELILVSDPVAASVARRRLPEHEPLDEWLRRMRFEEVQRSIRAHLELVKEQHERAEQRRAAIYAAAFAAAAALMSVLPVLGFLIGL